MRVEVGSSDGAATVVRPRLRALASRFPGSLRELDGLEMVEIRRRIELLERVLRGDWKVERWMQATCLFHSFARGALSAKRWLAGRKPSTFDDGLAREFLVIAPTLAFPEDAYLWRDQLVLLGSPPGGRLTELVFARVGTALGASAAEVRVLVFGPRRSLGR